VPAQRHDATARAADVAQQQLQDRGAPDELRAQGVLGPADGISEAGGPVAAGVLRDRAGEVAEVTEADAADIADHLRRVAGIVAPEDLEARPPVLQGLVAQYPGVRQGRPAAAE